LLIYGLYIDDVKVTCSSISDTMCVKYKKIKIYYCFGLEKSGCYRAGNPIQRDHPEKSSYFPPRQVTHYNVTILKNPRIFSTGQVTHYNVTNLKNPRVFQISGKSSGTIRPLAKPFSCFFFLSGRLPGPIRPLAKPFLYFILHRAGCLEQLDHSWNSLRSFIIGQVAQNNLIHFKKNKKTKKKWVVFQMTCFLISTSPCKTHMSIYYFQSFQGSKKKKSKSSLCI